MRLDAGCICVRKGAAVSGNPGAPLGDEQDLPRVQSQRPRATESRARRACRRGSVAHPSYDSGLSKARTIDREAGRRKPVTRTVSDSTSQHTWGGCKCQAEAITGSVLLALTPTELKEELGMWQFGVRKTLMLKIQALRVQHTGGAANIAQHATATTASPADMLIDGSRSSSPSEREAVLQASGPHEEGDPETWWRWTPCQRTKPRLEAQTDQRHEA